VPPLQIDGSEEQGTERQRDSEQGLKGIEIREKIEWRQSGKSVADSTERESLKIRKVLETIALTRNKA